jgi:hypothetical protein
MDVNLEGKSERIAIIQSKPIQSESLSIITLKFLGETVRLWFVKTIRVAGKRLLYLEEYLVHWDKIRETNAAKMGENMIAEKQFDFQRIKGYGA